MRFKIPRIPTKLTDACNLFRVAARLDRGGNNKGKKSGTEDITMPIIGRRNVALGKGWQVNDIQLELD